MDEKKPIVIHDPAAPVVEFQLQGRTWKLCFDWEAIAAYEQITGLNPIVDGWDFKPVGFAAMLCAGLLRHHKKITLAQVKGWLDYKTSRELMEPVMQALRFSMPEREAKPTGEAPANPPNA